MPLSPSVSSRRFPAWATCGFIVTCAFGLLLPFAAVAQEKKETIKETSSLGFVPATTVYYTSSLRNREQFVMFVKSRAFQKLMAQPFVEQMKEAFMEGFNEAAAEDENPEELTELTNGFQEWASEKENIELLTLIGEAVSEEIFFVVDESLVDVNARMAKVSQEISKLSGNPQDLSTEEMAAIADRVSSELMIPNFLLGFRMKESKRAEQQLTRLEDFLKEALKDTPLESEFKRTKINDGDFLQLTLNGEQIPWDEIVASAEDLDDVQRAVLEAIIPNIKTKSVLLNLGLWKGYLLFSVGSNSQQIETLGKGPLLFDHPQMRTLRDLADRRFTGITFLDDKFAKMNSDQPAAPTGALARYLHELENSDLPDELKEQIKKDLADLELDLAAYAIKPGGYVAFQFLTERGNESFTLNWAEETRLDSTKPLPILNHVGGNPLLVFAGRKKSSLEGYRLLTKWLTRGSGYFKDYVLPRLGDELGDLEAWMTDLQPVVERLDKATTEMLYPSLEDGQSALVIDGGMTFNPEEVGQAASEDPLPILLPALILGTNDSKLFKEALEEYGAAIASIADIVGKNAPEAPPFEFPAPATRTTDDGELFYYSIPILSTLEAEISPVGGVSESIVAFGLSPKHIERLLKSQPTKWQGPAGHQDRPLAAVAYLDFAGLVQVAGKWVDYAATQAAIDAEEGQFEATEDGTKPPTPEEIDAIADQVRVGLEFLACLRSVSSVTYIENGVKVHHTETFYQDIPEEEQPAKVESKEE